MGKARTAAKFLAPIFEQNDWQWFSVGTPMEDDICKALKGLKKSAKKAKGWAATGRLVARWDDEIKDVEYMLHIPESMGDYVEKLR